MNTIWIIEEREKGDGLGKWKTRIFKFRPHAELSEEHVKRLFKAWKKIYSTMEYRAKFYVATDAPPIYEAE